MEFFFFILLVYSCDAVTDHQRRNPPEFLGLPSINELALVGGYDCTNYEVITEDGYSLWLHRLGNNEGPPVLLQHGIMVAADSWITRGPKKDLAFLLLQHGFDVWLGNQRGTVYNEYSLNYSKSDPRFWEFSFDESGYYDLPASVDTVLEVRGKDQLFFIGHSLGTANFLVMASSRPEYNDKIKAAVLLSPIIIPPTRDETFPAIRIVEDNFDTIYRKFKEAGIVEIIPRSEAIINITREVCGVGSPAQEICLDIFGFFTGEDRKNLDREDWSFFLLYSFSGASLNTYNHYFGQVAVTGEFKRYDFGVEENLIRYHSKRPPIYPLDLATVPIALFWGYNDAFVSASAISKLESLLPNVILSRAVPDPRFAHNDMIIAENAREILYPDVIEVLESSLRKKEEHYKLPSNENP